jgi:hypothetical protein
MKKLSWHHKRFFLLFLICILATQTYAFMQPPQKLVPYVGNKPPIGSGSVTLLRIKLYDLTVWTKANRWSWNTTFVLQLKYARNFTRDEIVDASVEEINRVNRLDDSTKSQYRTIFENIFPDVKEGDTIAAVYSPNKPLLFYYNDNRIGVINNTDLAHKFLDIWLGDQTRDPELRDNVLKLSLVDS